MDVRIAFIIFVVLLAAGIWFTTWYFSADETTKRKLRGAPRKRIADVEDGELVRIVGTIDIHAPLLSDPLWGKSCVFHETILEERRSRGKHSKWVTCVKESDAREFLVVDKSGQAVIEVASMKAAVVKDEHTSMGFLNDPTPELEAFLSRHGHETTNLLGLNRTFRVKQGLFQIGEEVAILGVGRWQIDPTNTEGSGYRGGAKRLVIEAPDDGTGLLASDDASTLV